MNQQLRTVCGLQLRAYSTSSDIDIRVGYALACILKIDGSDDFNAIGISDRSDWMDAAEELGYSAGRTADVPTWFEGTPLAACWERGNRDRWECESHRPGTQEEWDKMSEEEKSSEWDSFHDLCERGIGEEHSFYSLLMSKWMVGYVGH